jgi:nitroreductase
LNVTIAFSQLAIHLIHFASFMDHQPANPAEPIDEDRLRAYVALIDKLLLGARENANSGRMNSWNFGIRQDLD